MARWEPDARGRLAQAALELYDEQGFEATAVVQIADRAGLTERTFFRHFADKREVLFSGSSELEDLLASRVADAPSEMSPLAAIAAALDGACELFEQRSAFARRRHAVISANRGLQERELIKLSSLSAALAAALRGRGLHEPAAALTAEIGVAVFKVAFERWVGDDGHDLSHHLRESWDELVRMAADGAPAR